MRQGQKGECSETEMICGGKKDPPGQEENTTIHLTRHDPKRNMARFYRLELEPDLFGGVVLVRQWGRIETEGQGRRAWFADVGEAMAARDVWAVRKLARGYLETGS